MSKIKSTIVNGSSKQNFSSRAGLGFPNTRTTNSKRNFKFLPFSNDSIRYPTLNTYPQLLARLAFESPTNGAAICEKSKRISGVGFSYDGLSQNVINFLNAINGEGETANDLLEKIAWDYAVFEAFALKVEWNLSGKIYSVSHIPFTDVRCGLPNDENKINYYVVSNNWDLSQSASLEKVCQYMSFNPKAINDIPKDEYGILTPDTAEQIEASEQLIYWWDYKPKATSGMQYYPVPSYICAIDQIITEKEIGISNASKLYNGVGGKTIVTFPFIPQTDEERNEIEQNFYLNYQSPENDGGVIITYATSKDDLPQVDNLQPLETGTHDSIYNQTVESIVRAHRIPAILLEFTQSGGFNNRAEEMKAANEIFQYTYVNSVQQKISKVFSKILFYAGYGNVNLTIKPFSLTGNTTADGATSLQNNTNNI